MKLFKKADRVFYAITHPWKQAVTNKFNVRKEHLTSEIINCDSPGVTGSRLCDHEVIVSLTTYGRRIHDVAFTIESIMQGTVKPNRIILWLGLDMEGKPLPQSLQRQQKRGLEVGYTRDIRSYTKIIPTLLKYPDAAIITIDDDVLYDFDVVENLIAGHLQRPDCIIANRVKRMNIGSDGRPTKYKKWRFVCDEGDDSQLNFLTGVGGVLYPPHSLHPDVTNEKVFTDICKFADDVWLSAMALRAGVRIVKAFTHNRIGEDHLVNEDVQDMGLRNINLHSEITSNDAQLRAVFDKYELWRAFK